jgi:RHS repeat-associated protein
MRRSESALVSVTVGIQTTQFVYDGDGNLIKQINQDGSKTIYIDGFYEEDRSSGGSLTNTRVYYPAGGAMRVNGVLYYDLRDNLGSAAAVMDSIGNIVGQERYYPFGGTRVTAGSVNTDRLYTGQRSLAALGLMDYHARFFEPTLGVFIQPDSMVPGASNPQSFNRYSYANNNPVLYNDPTGHVSCSGKNWDDGPQCKGKAEFKKNVISADISRRYHDITVQDVNRWSLGQLTTLSSALDKIYSGFGKNYAAFAAGFGNVSFTPVGAHDLPDSAPANAEWWKGNINIAPQASEDNMIHEMGHIFDTNPFRENSKASFLSQVFVSKYNLGSCTASPCYPNDVTHIGSLITIYGANTSWIPAGETTKYARNSSLEDFADSFDATITGGVPAVGDDRRETVTALIEMYTEPYPH